LAERVQEQQFEESLPPPGSGDAEGCPTAAGPDDENFCVAQKRGALYAERVSSLRGEAEALPGETDSDSEEHETVYDVVAESVGLNVSI
jgi:hypothetical protein